MIHLKRVGFILAATAVLATSLACEKEPDNTGNDTEKDFRDEIVGTYKGELRLDAEIVAPIPDELPDEEMQYSYNDTQTFEIIKDPVDPKGVILKDDDFLVEFVSGEKVSDGALFNVKKMNVTERDKDGFVYKLVGGKELYWLTVNGKKTKLYHASFDAKEKSFHFALNVEVLGSREGVARKYVGTTTFKGKK